MKTTPQQKFPKYNFEAMKAGAVSADPLIRKQTFIEYFSRFNEFPSFLFDNEKGIDASLFATMQDLISDINTTPEMRRGIDALLIRLPPLSGLDV